MEKHYKFSIWYVLIVIWFVLLMHNLIMKMLSVEHIPYSEFVKALHNGKIIEVSITADQIQGKMKYTQDGQEIEKPFKTVRVDQELSQLLETYNVTFKGVIESNFLKNLASRPPPFCIKGKNTALFGGRIKPLVRTSAGNCK